MNIGKLEQMTLRSVWETEPRFSDWLVSEEGLEVVERDLGVGIEEAHREVRPGDYPCDVVGRLIGDENHVVLIENQFGKTDHDHLGKLMTYAAMNRATTAIWLAEEVSDDHRSVIDWLNENTPPSLNFYLAVIRAFRISDSPVAPQLEVVCRPNVAAKVKNESAGELKERHFWRRALWEEIHQYIAAHNPPFRLQAPGVEHWSPIAIGRSGFYIAMLLNSQRKCIGLEFVAAPSWGRDAAYAQLLARKDDIARHIPKSLIWERKPDSKRARIHIEAPINPKDESNREQVKAWFLEAATEFYSCFSGLVKTLQVPLNGVPSPIFADEELDEVSSESE